MDAGPNPSVTFDWTPTLPRRGGCQAGLFLGNFSCTLQNALLVTPLVEGTLVMALTGPTEMGALDATRGKLTIITEPLSGQTVTANVLGRVTCPDGVFMGLVEETMVKPEQLGLLLFLSLQGVVMTPANMLTARGGLVGRLDANSVNLTGEITLMVGSAMCKGPFSLRAQQ